MFPIGLRPCSVLSGKTRSMTTLILQSAGSALGGLVGGPMGAGVGRALGGLAGAALDNALFGGAGDAVRPIEGPRLKDIDGLTSTEGAPIPRVYGRARVGGQLIWATRFEEVANVMAERTGTRGGKSFGGSGASSETTVGTTYSYFANLAVGLCEGPIAFVRRVWADGRELDLTTLTMRLHCGDESQPPDPLIVAKEGADNAPAYRGLAYVVFERLSLAEFGHRVPQFSFEVVRAVEGLGAMIRAVCLIPGASEFGYDITPVSQSFGLGATRPENQHQFQAATDVVASLDALQALCPNLKRISLVVSWFGDDLRAGHCTIAPRVESAAKITDGDAWSVAGLTRAAARAVSMVDGVPAYGGTPSDASVVRLIRHLKDRGLEVVLYPFVMMDVPVGNGLPDPHTGASGQPPYPWRGRITCDPAPGRPGTVDGTAAAAEQAQGFFAAYQPMVLHYANLAVTAGGVDGFIIGSELVGLTRVRSGPGVYPAVAALQTLADAVRAVLGSGSKIVYAADWTEYGAHGPDGGAEVRFPLDPLWAHPAIDESASIFTRRSPIGATGRTTPTAAWGAASTIGITCAGGSGPARRSIGITPASRTGWRSVARRSLTALMASLGCSVQKTSLAGGRTRMSSASAASKRGRQPGRRGRNRSGSRKSASRPSTRGRTARTFFRTRSRRNRPVRRCRAGRATILFKRGRWKRCSRASIRRCRVSARTPARPRPSTAGR